MSISSIYTYPIPKLSDGTPATIKASGTSTIADVRDKYVQLLGGVLSDGTTVTGTYKTLLKEALNALKDVLDGYDGIDTDNLSTTFSALKSDAFYTAAQTINKGRIDNKCREGFLAYRYYLKTIVSALDRIYGYLEDSKKALDALTNEVDSDIAHTLITQLEINEDFIHEEFQTLFTHYKYNADTKQWDKVLDEEFISQLGKFYEEDSQGYSITTDGARLQKIGNVWYKLDESGQKIPSVPATDYEKDAEGYLIDADGDRIEAVIIDPTGGGTGESLTYYELETGNESAPVLRYRRDDQKCLVDGAGDQIIEGDGKWYRLDRNNKPTDTESAPILYYRRNSNGELIDGAGYRIKQKTSGTYYRLDESGNLTDTRSAPVPGYKRNESGQVVDKDGHLIAKADDGKYHILLQETTAFHAFEIFDISGKDEDGYELARYDGRTFRVIYEGHHYYRLKEDSDCADPVPTYLEDAEGYLIDAEGDRIRQVYCKIDLDNYSLTDTEGVPPYHTARFGTNYYWQDASGDFVVLKGYYKLDESGNLTNIPSDPVPAYEKDAQDYFLDKDGKRIMQKGIDDDLTSESKKYYKLNKHNTNSSFVISMPVPGYERDGQGYLIDVEGDRIAKNVDGAYYQLDENGDLTDIESAPVPVYKRDAQDYLIDATGCRITDLDGATEENVKYYKLDENNELTDIESAPVQDYEMDAQGYLIDVEGDRIGAETVVSITGGDTEETVNYYKLDENGNSTNIPSAPVPVYKRDAQGYLIDANDKRIQQKYYKLNLTTIESTPKTDYKRDFGGYLVDADGDRIKQGAYGKYYKLGTSNEVESAPVVVYRRDSDGYLINTEGVRIAEGADGKYYELELTDTESTPIGPYVKDDKGYVLNDSGNRVGNIDGSYYLMGDPALVYATLQELRDMQIAYFDSTSDTGEKKDKPLTVFNSITLLDRLRYIRYYYRLILQWGATDYSIFPNDAETGYPCLPDVKATKSTEDTKSLGALEVFYVGYLTDRDGPINAVASFLEAKTSALRNNLSLQSKKISALNIYLDFINSGMNVLNESQVGGRHRIPDGANNVLAYLCGGKMYNLFEDSDGTKYLVVPNWFKKNDEDHKEGRYRLIKADDEGKRFLVGDSGSDCGCMGNACAGWYDGDPLKEYMAFRCDYEWRDPDYERIQSGKWERATSFEVGVDGTADKAYAFYSEGKNPNFDNAAEKIYAPSVKVIKDFKLPTELEVSEISPESVKGFLFWSTLGETEHANMIKTWTDAFSQKSQYINTAIDTINSDVSVDRSKIDTLDSLTSTFRSRAQDAYMNTVANIRG